MLFIRNTLDAFVILLVLVTFIVFAVLFAVKDGPAKSLHSSSLCPM